MCPHFGKTMDSRRLASLLALSVVIASSAACADRSPSAPGDAGLGAQSGTQVGTDTTTGVLLPERVRIHGRALVTTKDGPRAPGDTLSAFVPIAGARVTLYRNVLVDGRGVSQPVGERTTGADGAYEFAGVPGGYYILALNVTAEQFYGETFVYVPGTRDDVSADIRRWQTSAP